MRHHKSEYENYILLSNQTKLLGGSYSRFLKFKTLMSSLNQMTQKQSNTYTYNGEHYVSSVTNAEVLKIQSAIDYGTYNSSIDNCVYYFKNTSENRYKKLMKDLRRHYDILKINRFVLNLNFSREEIKRILDVYNENITNNSFVQTNDFRWIKNCDKYNNWKEDLYDLLKYHYFMILSLSDSLNCQKNLFVNKIHETDITNDDLIENETGFCNCPKNNESNK